jgi:hypothetical protein
MLLDEAAHSELGRLAQRALGSYSLSQDPYSHRSNRVIGASCCFRFTRFEGCWNFDGVTPNSSRW